MESRSERRKEPSHPIPATGSSVANCKTRREIICFRILPDLAHLSTQPELYISRGAESWSGRIARERETEGAKKKKDERISFEERKLSSPLLKGLLDPRKGSLVMFAMV